VVRSLSNIIEALHQSFFFYLLVEPSRFVSIGEYLPAVLALAAVALLNVCHSCLLFLMSDHQAVSFRVAINSSSWRVIPAAYLVVALSLAFGGAVYSTLSWLHTSEIQATNVQPLVMGLGGLWLFIGLVIIPLVVRALGLRADAGRAVLAYGLCIQALTLAALAFWSFTAALCVALLLAPATALTSLASRTRSAVLRMVNIAVLVASSPLVWAAAWSAILPAEAAHALTTLVGWHMQYRAAPFVLLSLVVVPNQLWTLAGLAML